MIDTFELNKIYRIKNLTVGWELDVEYTGRYKNSALRSDSMELELAFDVINVNKQSTITTWNVLDQYSPTDTFQESGCIIVECIGLVDNYPEYFL